MTTTSTTTTATTTTYPKEMHLFLLQNPDVIEQGSLTDAVTATVFTALHERIAQKLERRLWETHFDLLNTSPESCGETMFCPMHWPKRKDGSRQAYYKISEFGLPNVHWLSSLLGLNQTKTCFELYIDGRLGGPKINVKERSQAFYVETPVLHELGWTCTEGVLCQPFSLDAAGLVEKYPDLRKPMLIFEGFFDRLLKANEHIDKLITGMVPTGAKTAE